MLMTDLEETQSVLDGSLRQLHAVEDGAEDEGGRHIGNGARHDGGPVPADLPPRPLQQQLCLHMCITLFAADVGSKTHMPTCKTSWHQHGLRA